MDNMRQRIMDASAGLLGIGGRGIWLIIVYWSTIGLAVIVLGAHQFYLKVAANAAANPDSVQTIGDLIDKRKEYYALQDLLKSLEQDQKKAAAELQKQQAFQLDADILAKAAGRRAQAAAQRLARFIVTAPLAEGAKPIALPERFLDMSGRELVALVVLRVQSPDAQKLLDAFEQAEEARLSELEKANAIRAAIDRISLEKVRIDEALAATEKDLEEFIAKFSKRGAKSAS